MMRWTPRNWGWPFGTAPNDADDRAPDRDAVHIRPTAFAIDDDPAVTKMITHVLRPFGIETSSFASAAAVIAALKHQNPAVIFLDVTLEGSDAIDVIRGLGENSYCGIVQLMSGSDLSLLNDVRRVGERHRLNMRPPLEKPFRLDAIGEVVKAANLGGRAAGRVDVDEALRSGWLELWYQPKIDLHAETLVGAEALLRCRHPDGEVLLPDSFLPGAGPDSHVGLTEYVMLAALRDWDDAASAEPPPVISINTTVKSLEQLPVAKLIRDHRPKSDRWPGLILEVTETDVIGDLALAHEIATQLRIHGINLAIDDFGKACSSFTRLKGLPFSELKLDRHFVLGAASDPRNAGICQTAIDLAHHFGATAVAKGLENEADLAAMHRMGCDVGQGYLLAPPMPKADFVSLLESRAAGIGNGAPRGAPAPAPAG